MAREQVDVGAESRFEADSLPNLDMDFGVEPVAVDELMEDLTRLVENLSIADIILYHAADSSEMLVGLTWPLETTPARANANVLSIAGHCAWHNAIVNSQTAGSGAPAPPYRWLSTYDNKPPEPLVLERIPVTEVAPRTRIFPDLPPVGPSFLFDGVPNAFQQPAMGVPSVPVVLQSIPGPPALPAEPKLVETLSRSPTLCIPALPPLVETCPGPFSNADSQFPMIFHAPQSPKFLDNNQTCLYREPSLQRPHGRGPDTTNKSAQNQKLTTTKVNRKRPHADLGDDHNSGPATPVSNKRRNLGPPGSTPFARRLTTPLSRRLSTNAAPYSERLRRRQVESQGRIHRTMFRLPQLIAQTEADRQAAEATTPPCPELPSSNFDFSVEEESATQNLSTQSSNSQEPTTPETPQRGWNIRGLLNSVPRSFSRFIPSFGRSPERAESATPSSSNLAASQPSSERENHAEVVAPEERAGTRSEGKPRRRLSEQPPKKRTRDLSYSLFPPRMDRSLYLPAPVKDLPQQTSQAESRTAEQDTVEKTTTSPTANLDTQASDVKGREVSQKQTISETPQKKRKRSPSPDVIPNPAGSSYGLDLDYFYYSSDSDDDINTSSQQTQPQKADPLAKTAARSASRSERPQSKKVRFDASPEDTPSKLRTRARATDPYHGKHFIGMGSGSPSSPSAPATPTPAPASHLDLTPQRSPGFIPNTQGTFQLDYDAFSDDSESTTSSGPPSPLSIPAPSSRPESETRLATQPDAHESIQLPASRQTPRVPPSTPAKIDEEALARVRSQAEKYKPKTPSGLRTTSRYSSPMVATPDSLADKQILGNFGDDQFARDAEWLYEKCPSGDLSQLVWPEPQSYEQSLAVSSGTVKLLNDIWDDSEVDEAYDLFCRGLAEFENNQA